MSSQLRPTRGLTVQAWFNLIIGVLVVLICAGAVSTTVSLDRTLSATDDLIKRLMPARGAAAQLQSSFLNQETGVRGYALTADSSFLEPYTEGRRIEEETTSELAEMVQGQAVLADALGAIDEAAAQWRSVFVDPIVVRTPSTAAPLDPAVYERGRVAFDRVRAELADLHSYIEDARVEALGVLEDARELRTAVLTTMFAVLLAASIAFAVLIRTAIVKPLRRLSESSQRVVAGNFGHQVDAGRGPADIRALAEDIEAMRQRIVAELDIVSDRQSRLEAQTAKLDAQAIELRRSNAELEQFAYVTSHDLQEPLRKVASFCQLLEKRYADVLDERGKQYIDFAVDGAKRMQVLINDLLAFSRVGRVSDAFVPVPLDGPLDKALANLAAALDESSARIARPDRLPEIEGDATLLTMLWQNLIGNAVKFCPPDVVPEVSIAVERRPDGTWLVSVQDNGIGISPEFEDKIFVIFQRLHGRDEYAGTGIGLALCKKIVEYHGGEIWLDTDHHPGARFCFTLPPLDVTSGAADNVDTREGAVS